MGLASECVGIHVAVRMKGHGGLSPVAFSVRGKRRGYRSTSTVTGADSRTVRTEPPARIAALRPPAMTAAVPPAAPTLAPVTAPLPAPRIAPSTAPPIAAPPILRL